MRHFVGACGFDKHDGLHGMLDHDHVEIAAAVPDQWNTVFTKPMKNVKHLRNVALVMLNKSLILLKTVCIETHHERFDVALATD